MKLNRWTHFEVPPPPHEGFEYARYRVGGRVSLTHMPCDSTVISIRNSLLDLLVYGQVVRAVIFILVVMWVLAMLATGHIIVVKPAFQEIGG